MKNIKIAIDNRLVGDGEPCFIIAEAGVNHNGDMKMAKSLIDAAKKADADAVKFQIFRAEDLMTPFAEKAEYQREYTPSDESQYEMIRKLELGTNEFKELASYSKDKGILFLASPFSTRGVDLLDELGTQAYKVASGEITNYPLMRHIAKKGKPIIMSTGMATLEEVADAIAVVRREGLKEIILLHCVTGYPADLEDVNLKAMATLREAFKLPVGFSDHTLGINISTAAAALGASVIEKHFTLDKGLPGPDHRASLEPEELRDMVRAIRDVELAMGDGIKSPSEGEEKIKWVARRSLVAARAIPKGEVITEDMIALKRPGYGIEPKYLDEVVGRRAIAPIKKDQLLTWDTLS